jgi:hypothetical protein
MKNTWKKAWRECRLLNWGTLNFCYSREVAFAAMDCYKSKRRLDNLTMRLSLRRLYHKQGLKII